MDHVAIVEQGKRTGASYRRTVRGKPCLASADDVGQETWLRAMQGQDVRLAAFTSACADVRDTARYMHGRWGEGRATARGASVPLDSMAAHGSEGTTLYAILEDLGRDKPILAKIARYLASGSTQADCAIMLGVSTAYISKMVDLLREYLAPQ